jgi:cytochrome oxidase Cu insertion factor (SCO1/SenC/PrrC family)/cytochrome c2
MQRILLAAFAMLMTATVSAPCALAAPGNRWGENYFPNVPVVTQDGKTLRFYDDLIRNKVVIVSFIYTTCADLCPVTTARLGTLQAMLGDEMGRDVFFVSVSVDPEHDTPEILKAFGEAFDAGPGWQFVTGKPEDIKAITERFGDRSSERGLQEHRIEMLIGNDAIGDWERESALTDLNQIAMTVHGMDSNWNEQVRQTKYFAPSDTGYAFDGGHPGEVMFKRLCSSCHTIGGGNRVGPDLRRVAERRDRTWLTSFIMNPLKVRQQKDPTALALAAIFPGVRMPRLGLNEVDAADMISYLEYETARIGATAQSTAAPPQPHQHD